MVELLFSPYSSLFLIWVSRQQKYCCPVITGWGNTSMSFKMCGILLSKARFPWNLVFVFKTMSTSAHVWSPGFRTHKDSVVWGTERKKAICQTPDLQGTVSFCWNDWMVLTTNPQLWTIGKTFVRNIKEIQGGVALDSRMSKWPFRILKSRRRQPLLQGYHSWLNPLHCSYMSAFVLHSTPHLAQRLGM